MVIKITSKNAYLQYRSMDGYEYPDADTWVRADREERKELVSDLRDARIEVQQKIFNDLHPFLENTIRLGDKDDIDISEVFFSRDTSEYYEERDEVLSITELCMLISRRTSNRSARLLKCTRQEDDTGRDGLAAPMMGTNSCLKGSERGEIGKGPSYGSYRVSCRVRPCPRVTLYNDERLLYALPQGFAGLSR